MATESCGFVAGAVITAVLVHIEVMSERSLSRAENLWESEAAW